RTDVRRVRADGRSHPPDGVAAVAPVVHELLLALLGRLLGDRCADRRREGQQKREDPGPAHAHHCSLPAFGSRTVSTGQGASRITRSATRPHSRRFSPLLPCVPITIIPARSSSAVRMISSWGPPVGTRHVVFTPDWRSCSARASSVSSLHFR